VAFIFGTTFLLIGVSTGGWLFYSIGGAVLALSIWGFRMARRHIQQLVIIVEENYPPPGINVYENPLKHQNMTPMHNEDPAPPV
jgi:hypothetical protein